MTGYIAKTDNRPRDVIGQIAQAERESQWGPIPGQIVSYDAATQTATVKPLYKPIHGGVPVEMPELYEVPVDLPRTGSGGMTFPIPAGTKVILTPSMRSMDNYEAGEGGQPFDARSFSLSDMRASISGGDSLSEPLANVDPANFHLRANASGTFGMKASPDGKFQMTGAQGDIIDLLAEVCETLGQLTADVASGSSAGTWPITQQAALAALAARLRAMVL